MNKIKKAFVASGVGITVLAIGLTTAAAALFNNSEQDEIDNKQKKPKGKEKYTKCSLANLMDNSTIKQECLSFENKSLVFDIENFKLKIKDYVRKAISKIKKFYDDYQTLQINVSYLLVNNKKILIDCSWYNPSQPSIKYYDQFELVIKYE